MLNLHYGTIILSYYQKSELYIIYAKLMALIFLPSYLREIGFVHISLQSLPDHGHYSLSNQLFVVLIWQFLGYPIKW